MAMKQDVESALPNLSLVFGYIAVKELVRTEDRVDILNRLGYGNKEIAQICATTELNVRVTKSKLKKNRKRGN